MSSSEIDGPRDAAGLERDIDATRADVRETLAALERRLSLDRLVEMTIGRIRDRGGEFAGNLTDTAAKNPVPVLLTSIGLGWMMLMSRRGGDDGAARGAGTRSRVGAAFDRAESAASGVGDRLHEASARVGEAVDSSRETLADTAESVRAGVGRAAAATHEQIDYARERMDRMLHEQPLLLGALGIAAGALIGALLPTTEAEDRWLGDARSKAVKNAAQASRTRYEAAREAAAAYSAPASAFAEDESYEQRPARPH